MARRTDDHVILQMLNDGKTQKEIAEHFNVSGAAICKRVKKINAASRVEKNLEGLTDKQKNFALAIAEGKSQTQAAMESHDTTSLDSAKNLGSQLMARPDIQTAVAELMQEEGLTRRYRVQKLKTHIDHPDPNVSLKGLDQSWKLDGGYKAETIHFHMSYETLLCNYKDARAKRKELEKELGIDDDTVEGEIFEDDKDD